MPFSFDSTSPLNDKSTKSFNSRSHLRSYSHGNSSSSSSSSSSTLPSTSSSSTSSSTIINPISEFNPSTSTYILVQPASPIEEPIKSVTMHPISTSIPSDPSDSSLPHLAVRSRRARLPYFTPLQPSDVSSLPIITNPIKTYDYAHHPTHTSPSDQSFDSVHPKTPSKRPLHQKARSEQTTRLDLCQLGSGSSLDASRQSLGVEFQVGTTPMLRKKSGEVVRSSLKSSVDGSSISSSSSSSNRQDRSKSAPSTPTGPKAVHFDSHLEHVKHFLAQQRPAAVSRDGSPIETETEGEEEFPFPSIPENPPKLVLEFINFPTDPDGHAKMNGSEVYLRWLELVPDGRLLRGQVQVQNICFEKQVAVRFTLDNWQTVSEVTGEYSNSVSGGKWDRFSFTIRLVDLLARIEERRMLIALRYTTAGREIWDNNGGVNYEVKFKRMRVGGAHGHGHGHAHSHSMSQSNRLSVVTPPPPSGSKTTSKVGPDYQWSVTTAGQAKERMAELRAELDRLVGDDLGLSITQPTFKPNSFAKSAPESPIVNAFKHNDALSASNHIKANALRASMNSTLTNTPNPAAPNLAARYDFSNSLKLAVSSPNPSPRFETVPLTDSNKTNRSITNEEALVPRSERRIPPSPLSPSNFNSLSPSMIGSTSPTTPTTPTTTTTTTGSGVLESLRNFQEQQLEGGHNLESSDYGDLVQNFCWGGGEGNVNSGNSRGGEIGMLLESVTARFGRLETESTSSSTPVALGNQ
ncbi:hypothetical protein CROQUDRAFT_719371 [Cronartium quercuum f. sp. fusiforme G11]|uniref:CBM21 domain-containing protein n=1 Tax=Cronartium quercuum f. sp. fusiforme G11 TaxID=708437 RepID=A0A9P6NXP5_9BASI|nr:hypothetical protein CROQUDRAFT_719371 [Cronartium quercuum f. sp. fusiforme G11]